MIFRLLDFGPLSGIVQKYADLNGAIPSPGDRWQDFHWARSIAHSFSDQTQGEHLWQQFLNEATAETQHALEVFDKLHDIPSSHHHH